MAVAAVEPIVVAPNAHNARYLLTKQERMAHALLDLNAPTAAAAAAIAAASSPLLSRRRSRKGKTPQGKDPEKAKGDDDSSAARVRAALAALRAGQPVVLVDRHDAPSSSSSSSSVSYGDLVMAAAQATPQALSTFIRATSGIVYALLPPQRLAEHWKGSGAAATAGGLDARDGGGSSAAGRAATLRALGGPGPLSLMEFTSPGHVFAVAPGAAIGTAGDGGVVAPEGGRVLPAYSRVDVRRAWALELVRAAAAAGGGGAGGEEDDDGQAAATAAAAVAEMIDHDTGENWDVKGMEAWAARQGLCVASVADVARFLEEEEEAAEDGGREGG